MKSRLLKLISLLTVASLCLVSIAFGWYAENKDASANGMKVSTEEITEDGVIATDGNSEKHYKIHQEITANLKATKDFNSVKIKFEYTKLSESSYKTLCDSTQQFIRSDYLKNNIIYKPTTLNEEKNVMWNLYDSNNVIDFYKATLTLDSTEYTLQDKVGDSNIREFKREENSKLVTPNGSSDDPFSIKLNFGISTTDTDGNVTYTYPSYTITQTDEETTTSSKTTVTAMNYNVFLIGLSIKITFICEYITE